MSRSYVLSLSCEDRFGVVAAVSHFLHQQHGFITESAQFSDVLNNRFFMRMCFKVKQPNEQQLKDSFAMLAQEFGMDWHITGTAYKPKIMVLVSQEDHCLNDLLHRHASGSLPAEIVAVVSNHEKAAKMASWYELPFHHLPVTAVTKAAQEAQLLTLFEEYGCDLMVLARYMQILSSDLVQKIYGKAINIHHSFLPSFKGAKPYHQAYERGVKIIGATAHYVSNDLDEGPIIAQQVTTVTHRHAPEDLKLKGRDIECQVLARAVSLHAQQRVCLNGNKTIVFEK